MPGGTLTQASAVDEGEFFRNVQACAGGTDYAEQKLTSSSSPVMRWIPNHVEELGGNNVLTAKNVVISTFQLLVRGHDYKDIAKRIHVTVNFVRNVEQAAMMCEVKINKNRAEAPDMFTEQEYGRTTTVLDYERHVYRYWNGVLENVLAVPTDIDDNSTKETSMIKAWMQMTSVYIYIPQKRLYYAGRPLAGQNGPIWAMDIDDAFGFKCFARARRVVDNLKRHNPISMMNAQIVNEMGEEVTA